MSPRVFLLSVLCGVFTLLRKASAQDMNMDSNEVGVGPEAALLLGGVEFSGQDAATDLDTLKFGARVGVSAVWTDNVFLSHDQEVGDFIFTLAPGVNLSVGDAEDRIESWMALDYTASIIKYASESEEDAVDHNAAWLTQWRLPKLTLGTTARYQTVSGGAVNRGDLASTETTEFHMEAGNRDDREVATLAASARHEFTGKTSLDLNLRGTEAVYHDDLTIRELASRNWLDWQAASKTRLGLGYTLRHIEPGGSPSFDFHEAAVRARVTPGRKLGIDGHAGILVKQVDTPDGDEVTPTFSLRAAYDALQDAPDEPRGVVPATGWMADLLRQSYASATLPGQTYTSTDFGVTFLQRIIGRFSMALAVRGRVTDYAAPSTSPDSAREDDSFYVRSALIYERTGRVRAELFCQFFDNHSTDTPSSFDTSAVGLQFTWEL